MSTKPGGPRQVSRAALISDLHLSTTDPATIAQFIQFTKTLPGRADELFILGDFFDAYVGVKHLRVEQYKSIVTAFHELIHKGVAVTLLRGNRDFLLNKQFERATGARVAGDEDAIASGGRKFLLVHGDLFCINDLRYQAMRRRLRSPWMRAAARVLPLSVSLRIAAKLRKASVAEIKTKTPAEMGIVDSEVVARLGEGHDVVICGHVHDPRTTTLQNGTLVVLPAWPAAPGTCWIEGGTVRFESARAAASARA